MRAVRAILSAVWARRVWAYAAYMIVAVTRIPARTGFQLFAPACDTRLTLHNAGLSMTKVPHIVLFAVFTLLTALQFNRIDHRTVGWCLAATFALGLLVELEEGATRTGNCRLTDVLPDLFGALVVVLMLMLFVVIRRQLATSNAR